MHNEVNIPSKKWKCSILHKRCPFFSAEQTVRRWRSDGGRPQSDLGWLRSLTNHQHPWLARNVLSGQRNIDFKIECVHYFYSPLCTPLGQCVWREFKRNPTTICLINVGIFQPYFMVTIHKITYKSLRAKIIYVSRHWQDMNEIFLVPLPKIFHLFLVSLTSVLAVKKR